MSEEHKNDTKAYRRKRVQQYEKSLKDAGYKGVKSNEAGVTFQHSDLHYLMPIDVEEPDLFTLCLPSIWSYDGESAEERLLVLIASETATRGSPVAKVFTVKDRVWVTAETYLTGPGSYQNLLPKLLKAVAGAAFCFAREMKSAGKVKMDKDGNYIKK